MSPIAGETVETAAVSVKGVVYTLPRPARHCDVMRHIWETVSKDIFVGPDAQGFVTSRGRFVNRRKALRVVKAAGQPQIDHPALNVGNQLFSEDLW
jgi:hypothetical protein